MHLYLVDCNLHNLWYMQLITLSTLSLNLNRMDILTEILVYISKFIVK